jgi:hypothetical protein
MAVFYFLAAVASALGKNSTDFRSDAQQLHSTPIDDRRIHTHNALTSLHCQLKQGTVEARENLRYLYFFYPFR